jgi:hypothetical protein
LNTSIRVIAGAYYSNNCNSLPIIAMPTPSASNDYLVVEYIIGYDASVSFYTCNLQVIFPSCNTYDQTQKSVTSYVWDSNGGLWIISDLGDKSSTSYYLS